MKLKWVSDGEVYSEVSIIDGLEYLENLLICEEPEFLEHLKLDRRVATFKCIKELLKD